MQQVLLFLAEEEQVKMQALNQRFYKVIVPFLTPEVQLWRKAVKESVCRSEYICPSEIEIDRTVLSYDPSDLDTLSKANLRGITVNSITVIEARLGISGL